MSTATKEKSTALAVVDTKNYVALQEQGGAIMEAMEANLGEGVSLREGDLTRVPIPSAGGTKWNIPTLSGDEAVDKIEGILAYQCPRGLLWPSEDPEEGTLPLLVSYDLNTARLVQYDEQADAALLKKIEPAKREGGLYDWKAIGGNTKDAIFGFGTGKNGIGKRVKEQRVLYILTPQSPLPLVVAVSPGSLKGYQEFLIALSKEGIPYYRAVVSLSLEKAKSAGGQPYSRVVFKLLGTLSAEEGKRIKEGFSDKYAMAARDAFAG